MNPWLLLDTATMPGGGQLRLMKRGAEFSIRLGSTELMNSRRTGSEKALASLAIQRIVGRPGPQVLIGGLGMGFTLGAALAELGGDTRIVVAEVAPSVVAWARGPLAEVFGHILTDGRVSIEEVDVGTLIRAGRSTYDAILLDVDNGPAALTREANDWLYDLDGLGAGWTALRPGGVLAIWSSAPDRNFEHRLRQTGFRVDELGVRANGARGGARHVIWIASRMDEPRRQPSGR